MHNDESFLSLRDIVSVLFKRKSLIFKITGTTIVACLCYVFLMWPTYESSSQVLVRRNLPDSENFSLTQAPLAPSTIIRQVSQSDEINTMIAILKSRDLVSEIAADMDFTFEQFDQVVDYRRYTKAIYRGIRRGLSTLYNETKYLLHLSKRPTPEEIQEIKHELFLKSLAKALVIEQVPDSEAIQLGFRCSNPRLAQHFSNALYEKSVSWYLEKVHQAGNLSFYKQQAQNAQEEVEKIEKELADTMSKFNLIGFEERKKLLLENQFQAQSRLNEINAHTAALDAGLQKLEELVSNEPPLILISREIASNPVRRKVSEELADLEVKRIEAKTKFKKTGRTLSDLDERVTGGKVLIEKLPERIEASMIEGVNPVRQALRETLMAKSSELASLNAEKKVIKEQILKYEQDLTFLNKHVYRVEELNRHLKTQTSIYNSFLKNIELARVDEERQNARIAKLTRIQSAPLPLSPIKPRKLFYTLIASGVGLLLGVSWAFALEFNDNTFSSEAELKKEVEWPILGTLKRYKTK